MLHRLNDISKALTLYSIHHANIFISIHLAFFTYLSQPPYVNYLFERKNIMETYLCR